LLSKLYSTRILQKKIGAFSLSDMRTDPKLLT